MHVFPALGTDHAPHCLQRVKAEGHPGLDSGVVHLGELGCQIYNTIWPGMAQLCPGGVCDIRAREPIQRLGWGQFASVAGLVAVVAIAAPYLAAIPAPSLPGRTAAAEAADACTPPAFAVAIGHAELWKQHNGCS